MISWAFRFEPTPDERVADGEIRFDVETPYVGRVSKVFIHNLNTDGLMVRRAIQAHPRGTLIYIQDRADSATFASLLVTAPALERKGYLEVPVTCTDASAGGLVSGPVEAFFLPAAPVLATLVAAATDPVLVTLETAKMHLRITGTAHDPDVTQKMTAASASIRDYLTERNDPTWTPATVPPWVEAAVLLLLTHLYEHRGDEFGSGNENDDRVWSAIANLLRRSRDAAMA